MKSKSIIASLAFAAACIGVSVAQEELDPGPVIEGRQSALREIGTAFKGINDELRKSTPSLPVIRQYARHIDELIQQQDFWFPPGTGPESEIETAAKAEIWQQPAEFKMRQAALSEDAAKLAKVADGADLAAIKSQARALGATCKRCHDKFREEED